MGKCISCGAETTNSYAFDVAQYLTSERSGSDTLSKYLILETFHEYACSACIYPIRKTLIKMGIAAAIAGFGILIGTLGAGIEFLQYVGYGLIAFISSAYFLYQLGQLICGAYYRIRPTKAVSAEKGGKFVSQIKSDEVKAKYPDCTIFNTHIEQPR